MTVNAIDFDTLSNDPEELAKAFEQLEAGAVPADIPPKEEQVEQIAPKQNDDKHDQGQEQNQTDPEGVATKDGKHVIPYSVLKSERDARSRAEQMAREAQERVAALEAQVNSVNQGANNGESARTNQDQTASDISDEDLEVLKEDFPTVYKAVMASMAAAKALEAKLVPVEERVNGYETERAQSATESVQEAIDSVPKLAHIQATNPEAFALAQQFDNTLRGQTAWADRPLSERFAKVAEMVEATLGQIDLPGKQQTSQPSAEDLRKAAETKAKENAKATRSNVPTSLSEFPAGQHAAQDEQEAAEQMTALQLADKFNSMTPDQMDAYFQTL